MTNEQINRAIAEACGWTEISNCTCGFKLSGMPPYRAAHKKHIPDYCADLNEMHEAEGTLGKSLYRMESQLKRMAGAICFHASARQRAEAFLRTLGKWEEVQP